MFEKGNNLSKGRPKGAKNKLTKAAELFESLGLSPLAEAIKCIAKVDDEDKKAKLYLELASFAYAKPKDKQEVELTGLDQLVIVRAPKPLDKPQQ